MNSLIPKVILIGLAASISPVAVMVLITLMFSKRPLRNSLFFLLGFTLTLVAIAVVVVFVFHAGEHSSKSNFDAWIDIVLGALCLLAIPLSVLRKEKPKERGGKTAKPLTPVKSFTIGVGTMMINTSTMIIYISGVHIISAAKVGTADDVIAIALMTAVTLVTLLIPILLYVIFPKRARKMLGSLKDWLFKHNKVIGAAILLLIGGVLLFNGIKALV